MKKIEISDLVKVESSNINMIGFNGDTTYVQFKNGSIYSYPQTSREEFEKLASADSVGSYFSKTYRSKEEFNKLENTILVKNEPKPKCGGCKKMDVVAAVKVLIEAIKSDPGFRVGWKANIAMAFKDEYYKETVPQGASMEETEAAKIHKIANQAADNFLDLLCRDVK